MILTITAASLTANDTDAEGQALSVVNVTGAVGGTVSLVGGTITFTPTLNFNGAARFDYTVSDGAASDVGRVDITVNPINDAPVAMAGNATTNEDTAVTITLTGSDVGAGNVFAWPDEFLLDELRREPARDLLDLLGTVLFRIEPHAALGATERNVHDGALVGHQRGQRHDLVRADHLAVAGAALDRLLMLAVLGAPSFEDFVVIAAEPDGELKIIDVVAGLDLGKESRMNLQIPGCAVELLRDDAIEIEIFHRLLPRHGTVTLLDVIFE